MLSRSTGPIQLLILSAQALRNHFGQSATKAEIEKAEVADPHPDDGKQTEPLLAHTVDQQGMATSATSTGAAMPTRFQIALRARRRPEVRLLNADAIKLSHYD
jgi:hypothetical protein